MIGILVLISTISFLYIYAVKPYNYWARKNVKTGKIIPFFGDTLPIIVDKICFPELIIKWYNTVDNVRYLGIYQFRSPTLLIKSPELIKKICVKDFDHFMNHRPFLPEGVDEFWSKNLATLTGHSWKNMRSTLSPSFTSSKIKTMFVLICENAKLFVQHFLKKKEEFVEVEFKDAFTRYTNDVIASAIFGIHVNSLEDRENIFYTMGREATNFKSITMKIKFFLFAIMPKIMSLLGITLVSQNVVKFFKQMVKETIQLREEQNIKRPDMLGLLMEAREEKNRKNSVESLKEDVEQDLTDAGIAAQMFIFFLGGFETVSTAMCFMAYELAISPDVQKKLMEEIDENRLETGPSLYETITKMVYLDMVLSECLRKWPIGLAADRMVTKPYTILPEHPEEKPVYLDVDDNVMVPVYAIHHDPLYYPDPEKFDPERFSPENRKSIDPYTYLPFGIGPRSCIGSRFALLEIKAVFFYLLSHFEIVPVEKTNIPIKLDKEAPSLTSVNDFPLELRKRN